VAGFRGLEKWLEYKKLCLGEVDCVGARQQWVDSIAETTVGLKSGSALSSIPLPKP
jgi:hypothetical protein